LLYFFVLKRISLISFSNRGISYFWVFTFAIRQLNSEISIPGFQIELYKKFYSIESK